MRKRHVNKIIIALSIALFGAALLLRPSDAAAWVTDGLSLCARAVVPSLFPFFVASTLVVETGIARALGRVAAPLMRPLFGVGGAGAAVIIAGLLGGYPSGARTVCELHERGELSERDANRLLLFCNNAGPSFIIGYCGTVLGGGSVGVKLYAIHAVSALLIGIIARFFYRDKAESTTRSVSATRDRAFSEALVVSIKSGMTSILNVCAFVIFFAVLTNMLHAFGVLPTLASVFRNAAAEPVLRGMVEMTGGIAALGAGRSALQTGAASAVVAFGGMCVLCQTFAVMGRTASLSRRRAAAGKLLHGGVALILALLFM